MAELSVDETTDTEWASCMTFEGNIKIDHDGRVFLVSRGVMDLNRILSERVGQLTKIVIYNK